MEDTNQQPTIIETNTKKKNSSGLIVGLSLALAVAGIGFGVYGMCFAPKTTTVETPTAKVEEPKTEEKVKLPSKSTIEGILADTYRFGETAQAVCTVGPFGGAFNTGKFGDAERLGFIFEELQLLSEFDRESCGDNCAARTVSYDKLNKAYRELFAGVDDLEKADYELDNANLMFAHDTTVKYNEDNDTFEIHQLDGVGCSYAPTGYLNKIDSIEAINKDTFVVRVVSSLVNLESVYRTDHLDPLDDLKSYIDSKIVEIYFTEVDGEYKVSDVAIAVE